ncbi:DUF6503 family protein [Runella slithyformis]|uniref:Deoxyribose-phosphate aldolase n=1 Tax=Runella slithyformis (strain ATCC 29530 / DSM 19594 / LMG 11500 / NCIMB 11436 / LSU 4) TaxID=761193 RepID=A0A7U3ZMP2_RUNSL|nr:DUF6503 family protein [Runella slithyformis]AEI49898.1 hypothetical protein Runsl_3537 [Runella slithyformis DSM 19594]
MLRFTCFALLLSVCIACNNAEKSSSSAKKVIDEKAKAIVDQCIEAHGGSHYQTFDVSFDFRKFKVHLKQTGAQFSYERSMTDSLNNVYHDSLTNDSFVRKRNGKPLDLSQKDADKYREGINSIAYFVLLPYKLSEPAVNLKYVGETTIESQNYHKIKVTFDREGGGKDYEDEFCYWINRQTHTLDYLSYANGGPRFRKATKRHTVGGIVFQDYENYEILDKTISTTQYDKAFLEGNSKLLSKIEQANYAAK